MLQSDFSQNSVFSRILIFAGVALISLAFFSLISILLLSPLFGISIDMLGDLDQLLEQKERIRALEFLQIVQAISLFILPPFFFSWLMERNLFSYTHIDKRVPWLHLLMVFLLMVSIQPLINYLVEWNSRMHFPQFLSGVEAWMKASEEKAARLTEAFLSMKSKSDLILVFFIVAVLPAIGEELLFRGVIQRLLCEWVKNIHLGIFLAAFIFSAIHMQFFGFIPRLMLGMMLGYLFVWSGSLWLPISAHLVNNGLAVILSYLFQHGNLGFDPNEIGKDVSDALFILPGLLLSFVFLLFIYNKRRSKEVILID